MKSYISYYKIRDVCFDQHSVETQSTTLVSIFDCMNVSDLSLSLIQIKTKIVFLFIKSLDIFLLYRSGLENAFKFEIYLEKRFWIKSVCR